MATVDTLLRYIELQKADGLRLETSRPPALLFGTTARALSMPALGTDLIEKFLAEIVAADILEQMRTPTGASAWYEAERVGGFRIAAQATGAGLAVSFRPAAGPDAGRPPEPKPPRRPAPDPEPPRVVPRDLPPSTAIDELLWRVVHQHGSDLIVSAGTNATIRLTGEFVELEGTRFTDEAILGSLASVLTEARLRELEETGNVDLAYELHDPDQPRGRRFRVNLFRQMGGLAGAFRPIWDEVPTLAQLNLPESIRALAEFPHGLVLLTGPTGSGKSTTLAVLIEYLNRTRSRHIITLEDPVEFIYIRKRCLIHQREVGVHVDSFATGLRASLRESPDVILVGEMRDLDTIAAAITAAETGHLVLSTLHSGSATMAVDRIVDVFPEHQQSQIRTQLADVLRAVVTQRLIPSLIPRKRVPAVEVLRVNYAIANLIREHKNHQINSQIQTGRDEGMVPMDRSLAELVREGKISKEAALRAANDPRHFKGLLGE